MKFSPDSLEESLYLSHRFLVRDRLPRKALDLFAEDKNILSRLMPDLAAVWSKYPVQPSVARIYGRDGVVHDPRTGATSGRIKDVWKGHLDDFLEAWRRARG